MSDVVLKVENLYKQYRLGLVGTGTLKDDLQRFWASVRGKEDPLSKIGEENLLKSAGGDYVWALKDINFEVQRGEILGIIGKNGAGKSTLLKILSKVTGPTKGNIYVDGRIASLLEVGTGFHPELTGRENIFLNGAILGMKKQEIKSKLDEIVDFAGVGKYLETPVKRYSSGMYVRLAFAVAAHLEPEILIVDEVLAVGDVEFQKKAIGKMKDVSKGQGRTVLFVSHNMGAVQNLCDEGLLLENGMNVAHDSVSNVIDKYLKVKVNESLPEEDASSSRSTILKIELLAEDSSVLEVSVGVPFRIRVHFQLKENIHHFIAAIGLNNVFTNIRTSWTSPEDLSPGEYTIEFLFDDMTYSEGVYFITLGLSSYESTFHYVENAFAFSVNRGGNKLDSRILRTTGTSLLLDPLKYKLHEITI